MSLSLVTGRRPARLISFPRLVTRAAFAALLATPLLLGGCTPAFQRPYTWSLSDSGGAVMHDMRAEIASPEDLLHGRSVPYNQDPYSGTIANRAISEIGSGNTQFSQSGGIGGIGGTAGGISGGIGSAGGGAFGGTSGNAMTSGSAMTGGY